jgi:hypothetical protein
VDEDDPRAFALDAVAKSIPSDRNEFVHVTPIPWS